MLYDSLQNKLIMIDFGDFILDTKQYPYDENGSGLFMAWEQRTGIYDHKVDSYSFGIILAQMGLGHPDLFKFHGTLPKSQRQDFWERLKNRKETEKNTFWQTYALKGLTQYWSPELGDLIYKLTEYQSEKRISCKDALNHPFFKINKTEQN